MRRASVSNADPAHPYSRRSRCCAWTSVATSATCAATSTASRRSARAGTSSTRRRARACARQLHRMNATTPVRTRRSTPRTVGRAAIFVRQAPRASMVSAHARREQRSATTPACPPVRMVSTTTRLRAFANVRAVRRSALRHAVGRARSVLRAGRASALAEIPARATPTVPVARASAGSARLQGARAKARATTSCSAVGLLGRTASATPPRKAPACAVATRPVQGSRPVRARSSARRARSARSTRAVELRVSVSGSATR